MVAKHTVHLRTQRNRDYAKGLIDQAPDGWVVRLAEETRSDRQNARLWASIAEIQRQIPEMASYSAEDIKTRFMHALGAEMRFLPALEGQGNFPIGFRSSILTVEQFGALIELINEYGARHGVRFRDST